MASDLRTIKKHAEDTGYSQDAIRAKIRDEVWVEREVWFRAPDGRILISIKGYEKWVKGKTRPVRRSRGFGSPPPLT